MIKSFDFSVAPSYSFSMTSLLLTAHAEIVLSERNIKLHWVRQVLARSEKTEDDAADQDLIHALGKIAEHGDRVLRVVHSRSFPTRIITAYFDRSMRGKL